MMKLKVRMTTNIAGTPTYHSGEVVELEERIAKAWIAEGYAAIVTDEKPIERAVRS